MGGGGGGEGGNARDKDEIGGPIPVSTAVGAVDDIEKQMNSEDTSSLTC